MAQPGGLPGMPMQGAPFPGDGAQPLDRLLPEIRRTVPGQFLDAEGINRNGAPGYRLKWLTPEGRVIERDVDARTGRMMGPQRPGFGREGGRDAAARPEAPRGNFFPRRDDADETRFDRQRDFSQERRFSRPSTGEGGFGNRGGGRYGGQDAGEGRRPGAGRARGRGQEE
jgi:hypothetical protein